MSEQKPYNFFDLTASQESAIETHNAILRDMVRYARHQDRPPTQPPQDDEIPTDTERIIAAILTVAAEVHQVHVEFDTLNHDGLITS